MSPAEPFVTVVVPTYNRANMLGITLDSLINQNYTNYEIIVVDNNSSDGTRSVIENWQKNSHVPLIHLFEPRQGVHYARNTAIKHARGEILYYTDDDMIADADLLREIVKPFSFDSRVGTVSGRVLPKWESQPPRWVVDFCSNYLLSLQDRPERLRISTDCWGIMSCHQALRREALVQAGGFNPENTAGEWIGDGETGLTIKLLERGYWFGYTSSSITYHIIPPSRMTQQYLNKRFANEGNCNSYTDYRRYNYTQADLMGQILSHGKCIAVQIFKLAVKLVLRMESWRLNRARIDYYRNRIRYDARLMTDEHWRRLVKKSDWLEESESEASKKCIRH